MRKGDWIYLSIIALSAIALLFSMMLFFLSQDSALMGSICTAIDATNPCKTVQESGFAYILGFHNSVLGIVGFSAMMILGAWHIKKRDEISKWLMIAGCFISGIMSIMFLFLQTFVIKTFCIFCVVVDVVAIVLLAIGINLIIEKARKKIRK